MSKWDELSAKKCVTRNGGTIKGKQINVKKPGLKVWGAIDYLCNYAGYMFKSNESQEGN